MNNIYIESELPLIPGLKDYNKRDKKNQDKNIRKQLKFPYEDNARLSNGSIVRLKSIDDIDLVEIRR